MSEQERSDFRDWIARMADGGEFYRDEIRRLEKVALACAAEERRTLRSGPRKRAQADGEARG